MTSKINITKQSVMLQLDALAAKDGEFYIAFLPQLNISSHSLESHDKALKGLDDAIFLFFTQFKTKREIEDKLKQLGWVKSDQATNGYNDYMPSDFSSVPLHLLESNPVRSKHPVSVPHFADC